MRENVKPKQGLSGHRNSKNRKIQLKQDVSTSAIAENRLNPVFSKDYINITYETANYWSLLLRWDGEKFHPWFYDWTPVDENVSTIKTKGRQ